MKPLRCPRWPIVLALMLCSTCAAAPSDQAAIWEPPPHPGWLARPSALTGLQTPADPAPPGAPHVVLVTIETWRADRLGLYGSPRATSRWLESLAEDAFVFDRAIAPSSWTWPSVASIAAGIPPRGHGAVRVDSTLCLEADTLAETFHGGGWRTGFIGSNEYFEPVANNYRQGFEFYYGHGRQPADKLLEITGTFLDGGWSRDEPFFLHLHLFEPHCPYEPAAEALAQIQETSHGMTDWGDAPLPTIGWDLISSGCHVLPNDDRGHEGANNDRPILTSPVDYLDAYDAELLELDAALARLQQLLEAAGAWQDSWIVITGDHGEEFAEHGRVGHGDHVYAETTWVPLVVRPPGGAGAAARRIEQPVSLVELAPTLAGAVGLRPPESWTGRDLGPLFVDEEIAPEPVFSETVYVLDFWGALVDDGEHRLVVDGLLPTAHLYDADDRMDLHDLLTGPVDLRTRVRAAQMAGLLHRELLCQTACRVCEEGVMEMDPAHLEALRALGYTAEVSNRHPELQRPRTPPEHSIAQRIGRRTPRYPTPQECGRRASGAPIR